MIPHQAVYHICVHLLRITVFTFANEFMFLSASVCLFVFMIASKANDCLFYEISFMRLGPDQRKNFGKDLCHTMDTKNSQIYNMRIHGCLGGGLYSGSDSNFVVCSF